MCHFASPFPFYLSFSLAVPRFLEPSRTLPSALLGDRDPMCLVEICSFALLVTRGGFYPVPYTTILPLQEESIVDLRRTGLSQWREARQISRCHDGFLISRGSSRWPEPCLARACFMQALFSIGFLFALFDSPCHELVRHSRLLCFTRPNWGRIFVPRSPAATILSTG